MIEPFFILIIKINEIRLPGVGDEKLRERLCNLFQSFVNVFQLSLKERG